MVIFASGSPVRRKCAQVCEGGEGPVWVEDALQEPAQEAGLRVGAVSSKADRGKGRERKGRELPLTLPTPLERALTTDTNEAPLNPTTEASVKSEKEFREMALGAARNQLCLWNQTEVS